MGRRIKSTVEAIDKLQFHALPGRPTAIERAVRVDGTFVMVGVNGRVYTSQADQLSYWTTTNRMARTVEGLIRLGVLSPEAVEQHKAAEESEKAAKKKRWAAQAVFEAWEEAGLELTPRQLEKLKASL